MSKRLILDEVESAIAKCPDRAAAMDAMVRCLRQVLTMGWGQTDSAEPGVERDSVNLSAWTLWGAMIASARPSDEVVHGVWHQLDATAPLGWLPTDSNDEILRHAFDKVWPLE